MICSDLRLSAAAISRHCGGAATGARVAATATKLRRRGVEIGWREGRHSVWWYTKDEARRLAEELGIVSGRYRDGVLVPESGSV